MNSAVHSDPEVVAGARWFWWIAGLSLVNTVLLYAGADMSFVVGLGITTLASIFFSLPMAILVIAVALGLYFYFGFEAQKGQDWAFYAGLAVYTFDALIFVWLQDWMSVAFHGLAIYFIVKGLMALRARSHAAT